MTNASKVNLFAVLAVGVLATTISFGAFAKIAHAQDYNLGSYDGGGYSDGYDLGSYDSGYSSYGGSDLGSYDSGYASYDGSDLGSYDYGCGSSCGGGYDLGSYDSGSSGYDLGSYNYGCDSSCGGYDLGSYDSGNCGCTEQNGVAYTEEQYGNETPAYEEQQYGYSTPSYGYSAPLAVSAPSSYGYSYGFSAPIPAPSIPSAPIVINTPPSYQPTPPVTQPNIVTNNTCTNYSCNTVTNVSNSGNTVTTVIPVATAPVTYPAQYTIPTYQNVSCTISASPNSIQSGQYTYLTWQSFGATSATLTNYGNVAPSGSLSVQPYGSTSYVLTVYGQNGQTATCNTFVTVGTNYPSVTLSQIPYTGFDFGTAGDAAYWALLLAFALSAGYLLVYYKGGAAAFAGSMLPIRRTAPVRVSTPKLEQKAAPIVESKIEAPVQKPTTFASLPAFTNVRPTNDSMSISSEGGAPRIVINRA